MGMVMGVDGSSALETGAFRETGLRVTFLQMNLRLSLCSSAPGSKPVSHKIWKPLHTPNTRPPFLAWFTTDSMMGEKRAIAPLRR